MRERASSSLVISQNRRPLPSSVSLAPPGQLSTADPGYPGPNTHDVYGSAQAPQAGPSQRPFASSVLATESLTPPKRHRACPGFVSLRTVLPDDGRARISGPRQDPCSAEPPEGTSSERRPSRSHKTHEGVATAVMSIQPINRRLTSPPEGVESSRRPTRLTSRSAIVLRGASSCSAQQSQRPCLHPQASLQARPSPSRRWIEATATFNRSQRMRQMHMHGTYSRRGHVNHPSPQAPESARLEGRL